MKKWTRAWIPAVDLQEVEETDPTLQSVANRSAVLRELQRRENLERDKSGPAAGMNRPGGVAPGSDFSACYSPATSHGIPANDQPRGSVVAEGVKGAEGAQGQDQVSPNATDDAEKTSHAQEANQSILETADNSHYGVATEATAEPSRARE